MQLKCIDAPAVEPVSLAEARSQVKEILDDLDVDARLTRSIQVARELCENDCRRAFITQSWQLMMGEFPRPTMNVSSATWYGPQWGSAPGPLQNLQVDGTSGYEIFLPLPPLQSVDEIGYIDQDGNPQTMNVATDVIVDTFSEPARILPAYNTVWPASRMQANSVWVKFTAGYGDTADTVPAVAKQWMLTQIAAQYEMPQAEFAAWRETPIIPQFVDRLLDPIRVRRY